MSKHVPDSPYILLSFSLRVSVTGIAFPILVFTQNPIFSTARLSGVEAFRCSGNGSFRHSPFPPKADPPLEDAIRHLLSVIASYFRA